MPWIEWVKAPLSCESPAHSIYLNKEGKADECGPDVLPQVAEAALRYFCALLSAQAALRPEAGCAGRGGHLPPSEHSAVHDRRRQHRRRRLRQRSEAERERPLTTASPRAPDVVCKGQAWGGGGMFRREGTQACGRVAGGLGVSRGFPDPPVVWVSPILLWVSPILLWVSPILLWVSPILLCRRLWWCCRATTRAS